MSLDIRTLVFILSIITVVQLVVISLQYVMIKNYRGIGWWVWSSIFLLVGHIFMSLRTISSIETISIVLQNFSLILGLIFWSIGSIRFLGGREPRRSLAALFALFAISLLYYLFVKNEIGSRVVIVSATISCISFFIAYHYGRNPIRTIRESTRFMFTLFFVFGFFYAARAVMTLASSHDDGYFASTLMQTTTFLLPIIEITFMTLGIVMMVNQRLSGEMREAKENLETIFNTSPDAVTISNVNEGTFLNVNDGFLALSGFTREEAVGKSSIKIDLWKDPDARQKLVGILQEKGVCENFEAEFQRKDGTVLTGLLSAKILILQEVPHIISVTRDITSIKQAAIDKAQLQTQVFNASKLASLGTLVAGISHEILNPLAIIKGYLPRISAVFMAKNVGETEKSLVEKLDKATDRIEAIVRSLINFATPCPETLSVVDVHLALDNTKNMVEGLFETEKIVIKTDYRCIEPRVMADMSRLQQVIMALIINARDAIAEIRESGTIKIATRSVNNMIIVAITDDGVGIHAEQLAEIFDPFYTSKDPGKGTGLGLPIAYSIVTALGGKIAVESSRNSGSTFTISLPGVS